MKEPDANGLIQQFLRVPLICLPTYLQGRLPSHTFYDLFRATGFKTFKYALLIVASLLIWIGCSYADDKGMTDDQARQQCFKGKTIYCLALGIKEEKSGHQERALELFRIACKKHSTPGHLRACTPLLNLALKMNRLDEEVAPLEARCRPGGDDITCFYLGKEYLKMANLERADRYLRTLCNMQFRPPDSDDYGPCYHLAKGYKQAGQWYRARELFQFDCENHSEKGQPSCAALKDLAEMERVHREYAQKGILGFHPIEGALFFVVFMSVLNVWIWFQGGRRGLKYLSLAAPLVIWGSALVWVYWPDKPEFPASQWAVIYFALLQVSGMAIFAFRKLQKTRIPR